MRFADFMLGYALLNDLPPGGSNLQKDTRSYRIDCKRRLSPVICNNS